MSPMFSKQSSRPLSPRSYRAAVRRVRQLCDAIADNAEAQSPTERAILTRAINGLAGAAQALSRRHRGQCVAAALCEAKGHAWVGTGDNRVVCDDCGSSRTIPLRSSAPVRDASDSDGVGDRRECRGSTGRGGPR